MKDRLEQFLQDQGLKSGQFAQIMEVQPSNISHILSGRNKPGFDFIATMLQRFPTLSPDWLISGLGEMYRGVAEVQIPNNTPIQSSVLLNKVDSIEVDEGDSDAMPSAAVQPAELSPSETADTIVVLHSDGTFSKYTQRQ